MVSSLLLRLYFVLDVYALCPGNKVRVMKLLSVDPANYPDAPRSAALFINCIVLASLDNRNDCSITCSLSAHR